MAAPRSQPLLLLVVVLVLQATLVRWPPPVASRLVVGAFVVARAPLSRPRFHQQHRSTLVMMAGKAKAPSGLSLEQVSSKLKFEVTDLDEGVYGLDSKVRG